LGRREANVPNSAAIGGSPSAAYRRRISSRHRSGRNASADRDTPAVLRAAASRTALVNRLRTARSQPVATVVAPAGYGKTTLLAQWAARDERAFAWASLAGCETDPVALLTELTSSLGAAPEPLVVVIDDAHLLPRDAAQTVTALIALARRGSMVMLAGRAQPRLPGLSFPRLRARGQLLELGVNDLVLTQREARALLHGLGLSLPEAELSALIDETEGWAAGIAAGGAVEDYLRTECLDALAPELRAFLERTSVLERMCGPLCDAVLRRPDSQTQLESLEERSLFVVPLDRCREWFRYHRLFREQLRRDLAAREPELVPALHRRAADWYESHGDAESAMEHAYAAEDFGRFMRTFERIALPARESGRDATVEGWLARVDEAATVETTPGAAVLAARLHAERGSLDDARRFVVAAAASEDDSVGAKIGVVHAAICAGGASAMLADVESALEELAGDDPWRPFALLLQGTAYVLLDEAERGDAILSRAVHAAERFRASETRVLALTERSLIAEARGEYDRVDAFLREAREGADGRLERYGTYALTLAASGRALLRQGRWASARAALDSARRLLPGLTGALPWLAAQARLELATAYVMLRDSPAARSVLAQVDELLGRRPNLDPLRRQRDLLEEEVAAIPPGEVGRTGGLTAAEFRLLPLLATHLSFREIGAALYLSRHTVKTQAISVYRKLGASSRSKAVERAERLGLVTPSAFPPHVMPSG
jgi:LuxR family maltose regulon positive regulatory protein